MQTGQPSPNEQESRLLQLFKREKLLHAYCESTPLGVFLHDLNHRVVYINKAEEELIGYTLGETQEGRHLQNRYIVDEKDFQQTLIDWKHATEECRPFTSIRRFRRKDGRVVCCQVTVTPLRDQGVLYGYLGTVRDITEHQLVEEQLIRSERLLREAQAAARIGYYVNHLATGYWESSQVLDELFGIDRNFIRDTDGWGSLIHPEDRQATLDHFHDCLTFFKPFRMDYRIYRHHDGELRWMAGYGDFEYDEARKPVRLIGCIQDITERKEMEEKFLRTQRMEAIGSLASGVAHDLNNILAPILLSSELLHSVTATETRNSLLTTISESAKRGGSIVKQVLTFARGTQGELISVQLNHITSEIKKTVLETFPRNITIKVSMTPDLRLVEADPTQIHQLILNLCINARDAMPNGGVLLIETASTVVDEASALETPDAKAGEYSVCTVSDTGTGIPQEIIPKIFDPFFTTKGVGAGTGLGLSTCIGIARSLGGFITVKSQVGLGTTFKVFLPVSTNGASDQTNIEKALSLQGQGETILLVDDETAITTVISNVLANNGYDVITAVEGEKALKLYRKNEGKIDLVVTDIMMPEMDGVELVRQLREISPLQKIIASSGRVTEEQKSELKVLGVNVILQKPYDSRELLVVLHDAIHG